MPVLVHAYLVVPGNLGVLLAGSLVNLGVFGILRVYLNWLSGQLIPDGFAVALLPDGRSRHIYRVLCTLRSFATLSTYWDTASNENTSFMLLDMGLIILFSNHGLKLFAGLHSLHFLR